MEVYLIFLLLAFILITLGDITRVKGFNNLTIRREIDQKFIFEGEEGKITTIIENNKYLPISFLYVEEIYPIKLSRVSEEAVFNDRDYFNVYNNKFSVFWFERIRKTYKVKALKRGTYMLKEIKLSIGDIFGFSYDRMDLNDYIEIVVYPKITEANKFNFGNTNIEGDTIVKRWIFKDPLYIKGIREYNVEDRMKDIHWQSSLKMGKLMVKDYDYTSESEVVFILNNQCGTPCWSTIDGDYIEEGIKLVAALASQAISEGFAAGMWTNSYISSYEGEFKGEVEPSINGMRSILELCARIDYSTRIEFAKYLSDKAGKFNLHASYVIVTSFIDENSIQILYKLRKAGINLKIIDMSQNGIGVHIEGIEKIIYKGERA